MGQPTPATRPVSAYRGRFAPSPTGPLHFGSVVSAVASCARARSQQGTWLVRLENNDHTREVAGAADTILHQLEALGMRSDEPVERQSDNLAAYLKAVETLITKGSAFRCGCSRRDLGPDGRYPGTCRHGIPKGKAPRAVRAVAPDCLIAFTDVLLGDFAENVALEHGDFVIHRADDVYAYQLAVVVDDARQGITEVVRGQDILSSTARQRILQTELGLDFVGYLHHPVAVQDGNKLSKSEGAAAIDTDAPLATLLKAWEFLGQAQPTACETPAEFWAYAAKAFDVERISREEMQPLL